jgi:hypothetical protein
MIVFIVVIIIIFVVVVIVGAFCRDSYVGLVRAELRWHLGYVMLITVVMHGVGAAASACPCRGGAVLVMPDRHDAVVLSCKGGLVVHVIGVCRVTLLVLNPVLCRTGQDLVLRHGNEDHTFANTAQ